MFYQVGATGGDFIPPQAYLSFQSHRPALDFLDGGRSKESVSNEEIAARQNSPAAGLSATEASHDSLPQVDAKGLEFNAFFQRLAVISSTKSVAHLALLDICFSKELQK